MNGMNSSMKIDRRDFLKTSAMTLAAISLPGFSCGAAKSDLKRNSVKMKNGNIKKAAVIWYSQAGNTERNGKVIAHAIESMGIRADRSDYRDFNVADLSSYDLIVMGSPVFYYDVPENFQNWIKGMPSIDGVPVAGYVTFGGEGGNQHNTACTLLELLRDKGGIPVGMKTFGNMSTYSPTWAMGMDEKILKYKHLPNDETYSNARNFAGELTANARNGKAVEIKKEFNTREWIKGGFSIQTGFKIFAANYTIDAETCIKCEACVTKCPTGSIDLSTNKINKDKCIACCGCINNCPVQAVSITYMGKKMTGFKHLLKKHAVTIKEPLT